MKRILFLALLVCAAINCNAEYWLCQVMKNVNLRVCPSIECDKLCTIPSGSYVLADFSPYDDEDANGFVSAVYVDKDIHGYVSSNFLKRVRIVDVDEGGVFELTGRGSGYDPELNILNDSKQKITVKINANSYSFKPGESRTITCQPGKVSIMASSPGVIPYVGEDNVEANGLYDWKFFIVTSYR